MNEDENGRIDVQEEVVEQTQEQKEREFKIQGEKIIVAYDRWDNGMTTHQQFRDEINEIIPKDNPRPKK